MSHEQPTPLTEDWSERVRRQALILEMDRPPLPGNNWRDGNMFSDAPEWMPYCDMDEQLLVDKVWKNGTPDRLSIFEKPEDAVLADIFHTPAVRRLQAIEQLTLPPEYTTIPNTGAFSRFGHIWGSVLFVRQMAAKHNIVGREAVTLQLRTLVSDVAHTFGSHLGDWMFQGIGGAENQHDIELKDYLEAVGINDILRAHEYEPDDVIFPPGNDWVEATSPDLCVDRADYGLREMNRWNQTIRDQGFSASDFTLTPDGMLAMTDQQRARIFSEGYLLLSQEHWSEPTHRFLLDMLMLRTKLFYAEGNAPRTWVFETPPKLGLVNLYEIHPRDLMYVTEPAQTHAYASPWDEDGMMLQTVMGDIARHHRQYVWPDKADRIAAYLGQFADADSYHQITNEGSYTAFEASSVSKSETGDLKIMTVDEAAAEADETALDFLQLPFRNRQIDPLVQVAGGFERLSELDPTYAQRLAEQDRQQKTARVARLLVNNPQIRDRIKAIITMVETDWPKRLASSRRMTADELKNLVSASAMEVHGVYPFMWYY